VDLVIATYAATGFVIAIELSRDERRLRGRSWLARVFAVICTPAIAALWPLAVVLWLLGNIDE
jgi:hypothetical protein